MDPFLAIDFKGRLYKTKVLDGAGKHPIWNETFNLPVESMAEEVKIGCYDEDLIVDDLIGETTVTIAKLCSGQGIRDWIPIHYKG